MRCCAARAREQKEDGANEPLLQSRSYVPLPEHAQERAALATPSGPQPLTVPSSTHPVIVLPLPPSLPRPHKCLANDLNRTILMCVLPGLDAVQLNPGLEAQAAARIYRLGQTRPTRVIRLLVSWSFYLRSLACMPCSTLAASQLPGGLRLVRLVRGYRRQGNQVWRHAHGVRPSWLDRS